MGSKSIRVIGIFAIMIIILVMAINIPINTDQNPQTASCEFFSSDGSCAKFEYDTILTENLNSIIDAETTFTDIDENTNISLGSEKMVLVAKSILLDSNQKIVSNSSQNVNFNPATLLDLNKNILDLGSVQLTFDLLYKKNANVIVNGVVEVVLDEQSKGKRYLSFSGQLPTNLVRLNVDKESKLLSDRTQSLTFTLADEGKDWTDGSVHTLKIILRNLDAQIITNGEIQNFKYGENLILYQLEMTVDQTKQVSFDENNNAVSVFKADGVLSCITSSSSFIEVPIRYNNKATVYGYNHYWLDPITPPPVKILQNGKVLNEPVKPNTCSTFTGVPRNSNLVFVVENIEYNVKTGTTKPEYTIYCAWQTFSVSNNRLTCSSNFGWEGFSQDRGYGRQVD